MTGLYVTIEGIDGSGKSTLVDNLSTRLPDPLITREPGDTIGGEAVREALQSDTDPVADTFLFLSDRAEHLETTIKPALDDGRTVICDRGWDSTLAYRRQLLEDAGIGRPRDWLENASQPWNIHPDLTILLDIRPETAEDRMDGDEKYENLDFLKQVRNNYVDLAIKEDRIVLIPAGPKTWVADRAEELIRDARQDL